MGVEGRMSSPGESAGKPKNATDYSKELCEIIIARRHMNKQELFDKIFEILDEEVKRSIDADQQLWYDTCNEYCTETQRVTALLSSIFYTQGKHIINTESGIVTANIGLPRILFFELLLYLIEKLDEKPKQEYTKEYFEDFITAVNRSDDAGILSYGVSDIEYFMFVTTENPERITPLLRSIDSAFVEKSRVRTGNYTLAHVISSYCSEILKENHHLSQSYSQPDSQQDSQPDSLLNAPDNWRSNIRLATPAEIAAFNKTHAQKLDVPPNTVEVLRIESQIEAMKNEFKAFAERLEQKRLEQQSLEQKPLKPCRYGDSCYNKKEEHLAKYSHPTQDGSSGRGGGRRHQSKKSKRITVRCSPSSSFSRHTRHTRHTRRHRFSKRARKVSTRRR